LAAGLTNDEDPKEMYASDVVIGAREGVELTMIESYVRTGKRLSEFTDATELFTAYPELGRALSFIDGNNDEVAARILDLHRRHGVGIMGALQELVRANAALVVGKDYPPNSLLGVVVGRSPDSVGARQSPTIPASENGAKHPRPKTELVIDEGEFKIEYGEATCVLGNTREFRFIKALNEERSKYKSHDWLARKVWDEDFVEKNTIQRVASNLRRRLREDGIVGVEVDGTTNRGHYSLKVASATASEISENSAIHPTIRQRAPR
jgi:DNA-binding winged helix-turn-helix (wHTH) protein